MTSVIAVCSLVVGAINFLPVVGMLPGQKIQSACAVMFASSDLTILMRHQALYFSCSAARSSSQFFMSAYQGAAMLVAGDSAVGIAALVHLEGDTTTTVHRALLVDYVGIRY